MRRTGQRPPVIFTRWIAPASILCATIVIAPVWAGDDDGPELSPPLDAPTSANPPPVVNPARSPIISSPAKPSTPVRPAAVLAIPRLSGAGSPSSRPVLAPLPDAAVLADSEKVGSSASASGLSLDGPLEMPSNPRGPTSGRPYPTGEPSRPLGSELVPIPDPIMEDRGELAPLPGSSPRRSTTTFPSISRRIEPTVPSPTPRRGRFFGLFAAPVVVPPTALNSRPASASPTATGSGRDSRLTPEDPKAKAAAEVALKRRIEKQARDSVGDRARSIEVHVDRQTAGIRASGVKFYQKRTVRKILESLPALTGLRSTIEVSD